MNFKILNILEQSPTDVLIIRFDGDDITEITQKAEQLRDRGYNVEVYHEAAKMKNQIRYADRKSIPYILFPSNENQEADEIKNLKTGDQVAVDLSSWGPDVVDGYRTRLCVSETVSVKDKE